MGAMFAQVFRQLRGLLFSCAVFAFPQKKVETPLSVKKKC